MKTQTLAQFLNIRSFPHFINNDDGKPIYMENENGGWVKNEYDKDGYLIYTEFSDGFWCNYQTSTVGNPLDVNAVKNIYENTLFKSSKELSPQQVSDRYGISVKELKY
jgi:hypothetical protein